MTLRPEQLERMGRGLLREGRLEDHSAFVVPVMTEGRKYGRISQMMAERGMAIPDLRHLGDASCVRHDGRLVVCVALWAEENHYAPALIARCARSAVLAAARAGSSTLAMPLLGGKEGMRLLAATTQGVLEAQDWLDERELPEVEVILVTDLSLT